MINKSVCIILVATIIVLLIPGGNTKNTLSVLSCRANQCFEQMFSCISDKVCSEQYSNFNICMQKECLASKENQSDCYAKCKINIKESGLQEYIKCTDDQCNNESFYKTCGDSYQNLYIEQVNNSDIWKAFSKELDQCVQNKCKDLKQNQKQLLQCRLNQSIECSKMKLLNYKQVSFLTNFYECTSKEIENVTQDGISQKSFFDKILNFIGIH